ncbi:sigma 54-interacting transcriptional regulator [uncultured Gemmiger sp.]|uniref:sigma 54-interacting transcriptional regulator n=1 Tax=uncultured Gemmiger sp. TaxID=1623490 RepID=UPI0025FA2597|nr:sigma 54-interacting transcriptional regulator [uncultured Gemmiger sp.]
MNHIAMLLPREELVRQAREQARGHDSVTEIRCIATEHAVEEARASIGRGAAVLIARGLQALRIREHFNVPVVSVRLTAQGIGLLLRKAHQLTQNPRPRVAMVVVNDMLCDTSCCNLLFNVDLQIFVYRTEEEYAKVNREALSSNPDVIIGGDKTVEMARQAGAACLFLDFSDDSFQDAIQNAETVLQADEMNQRANAQIDALLNNTTNGYIQVNRAGKVVNCNEIMLKDLGATLESLKGRPLQEVIPGLEPEVIETVLQGGSSYSTFLHIHYQAMVAILAPIRLENGKMEGAILSCHKVHRTIQLDPAVEDGQMLSGNLAQRTFDNVHHRSPLMSRAVDEARLFSQSEGPILLSGPQGSEIRLLAQCIHNNSANATGPLVQLNCATMEPDEQMTTLFGTGYKNKDGEVDLGVFGIAENGTLMLQEIDKLSYTVQSNIYQAVRYRRVIQRNLERPIHVNTRLIATSEVDLWDLACEGRFRSDLYYLLAGLRIDLPPLKKRPEDLADILKKTFEETCETFHRYHVITSGGMQLLQSYDWPGNIIQVNSFMERLVLTATHRSIDESAIRHLWQQMFPARDPVEETRLPSNQSREAQRIAQALARNDGNRALTAQELGISTTTLWRKIKKLGIEQ